MGGAWEMEASEGVGPDADAVCSPSGVSLPLFCTTWIIGCAQ